MMDSSEDQFCAYEVIDIRGTLVTEICRVMQVTRRE
jgi:hypothetical protein